MQVLQQHKAKGQDNSHKHKDECGGSQLHKQTIDCKNVIFMRHGKIEFSYHSWSFSTPIHIFWSFLRDIIGIKKNLQDTKIYIFLRGIIKLFRKVLYSIITSKLDYKDFDYRQFMTFLLHEVDPPLSKKDNEIRIEDIPKEIDVIYCSSAKRSIQTASIIQKNLKKLGYNPPRISFDLRKELEEVKFSKDILTIKEFKSHGGLLGCRTVILRKWYNGQNLTETFQNSIKRVERLCQLLSKTEETNILLVTHGWYLRLLKMYFLGEMNNFTNLRKKDKILNYGQFFQIQLSKSFRPHPSFPQRLAAQAVSLPAPESQVDVTKTLEAVHHS